MLGEATARLSRSNKRNNQPLGSALSPGHHHAMFESHYQETSMGSARPSKDRQVQWVTYTHSSALSGPSWLHLSPAGFAETKVGWKPIPVRAKPDTQGGALRSVLTLLQLLLTLRLGNILDPQPLRSLCWKTVPFARPSHTSSSVLWTVSRWRILSHRVQTPCKLLSGWLFVDGH